jgi:predicted nucleic acid-binding protein
MAIKMIEEAEPWRYSGHAVVVDTSVLIDFAFESANRHQTATELVRRLVDRQVRIRVPFHAAFEFQSANRRATNFEGAIPAKHTFLDHKEFIVELHHVPINTTFVTHYGRGDLPYLKGGDLIFLALARGDNVPIITEDGPLLTKARQAGAEAFTAAENIDVM